MLIDDLRSLTEKARTESTRRQQTEEKESLERLKIANENAIKRITGNVSSLARQAATEGRDSLVLCKVGVLGYINSEFSPEYGTENWDILRAVERYCKDLGFKTNIGTRNAHGENYSYLEISW